MSNGKYIVLEGPEGVGKTTQILELTRRLQAAGLPVRTLREPDSQSDLTARALRQLTQDPRYPMNTNTEVLLYNAARSQSLQVIKKSIEQGVICIVDRNYLTTLAIQYYGRGDVPDYETINKIITFAVNGVEPDLCIVLDAPVQTLKERAKLRGQGERFDNLDEAFLERVRAGYLWEAKQRNLPVVFATDDQAAVTESIWKLVTETLAIREGSKALASHEPTSVKAIIDQKKQTSLPHEPPLDTAPAPNTLAITNELPLVATNLHLTLTNISQLLYSILEAQPGISYQLRPAVASNDFPYFVPPEFDVQTAKAYRQKLTALNDIHQTLMADLATYAAATADKLDSQAISRAVLPVALTATIDLYMSAPVLQSLVSQLLQTNLPEAHTAAAALWDQARTALPAVFSEKPPTETTDHHLTDLVATYLPETYTSAADQAITLSRVWPKSELSAVAEMLYASSNLSLAEISDQVDSWPYAKKAEVFTTYLTAPTPESALEKLQYSWDLVTSYALFQELQMLGLSQTIERQLLTPRYGYTTPDIIETAGLTDQFEECFSLSLTLYSQLQEAGYTTQAQYAILQGHKMRYSVTHTARDLAHITNHSLSEPARQLLRQLKEKLAEAHPLLAETLDN